MSLSASSNPWFVLKVKTRHEKVIANVLRGMGYPEFLPLCRSDRQHGCSLVPLFPTYVFCSFDPLQRLPILCIPGVFQIVGANKKPERVDEAEIVALDRATNANVMMQPWPFLAVGDRVRVEGGPLRGLDGILIRVNSVDRLVLSVTLLQRSVSVQMERSWLGRIELPRSLGDARDMAAAQFDSKATAASLQRRCSRAHNVLNG